MNSDMTATPLELAVTAYLLTCRARGLARSTVDDIYERTLRRVFIPWCTSNGIRNIDDLDQGVLDNFSAELLAADRGLSRGSVHTYVRAVARFLRWVREEAEGTSPPRPRLPAVPRPVMMTLTRCEIRRLESFANTERDRLILRVLSETGLRVGELCSLTAGDIEGCDDRMFLRIRGKGNTTRLVPVAPDTARRVVRMAQACNGGQGSRPVFRSRPESPGGHSRALTTGGVRQMTRRLARRAGMTRRVHPHLFRHTFATEALRCGMDSVQLATILGHSGVAMIEKVYAHLTADDAYDAIIAMHTVTRDRERAANRRPIPSRPRGTAVRVRPQRRRARHAL